MVLRARRLKPGIGLAGVLIANPVYADGGGNVSLTAGQDVLGRRDVWQQENVASNYDALHSFGYSWIGTSDQLWRSGVIGNATDVRIDPQLFQEGVGALGGGDIRITAGRDVSDLSVVDDTTMTTANVSGGASTLALWTFGGGNIFVDAGRDLLGGRIDIGSGIATIDAGRDVASAGTIATTFGDQPQTQENELRIRIIGCVRFSGCRRRHRSSGYRCARYRRPKPPGRRQSRLPRLLLGDRGCLAVGQWQPSRSTTPARM